MDKSKKYNVKGYKVTEERIQYDFNFCCLIPCKTICIYICSYEITSFMEINFNLG